MAKRFQDLIFNSNEEKRRFVAYYGNFARKLDPEVALHQYRALEDQESPMQGLTWGEYFDQVYSKTPGQLRIPEPQPDYSGLGTLLGRGLGDWLEKITWPDLQRAREQYHWQQLLKGAGGTEEEG